MTPTDPDDPDDPTWPLWRFRIWKFFHDLRCHECRTAKREFRRRQERAFLHELEEPRYDKPA